MTPAYALLNWSSVRHSTIRALALATLMTTLFLGQTPSAHAFGRHRKKTQPVVTVPTSSVNFIFVCYSATECPTMPKGWDDLRLSQSAATYLGSYVNPNFQTGGKTLVNFKVSGVRTVIDPEFFDITGGSTGAEQLQILDTLRGRYAVTGALNIFVVNSITQFAAWADLNKLLRDRPSLVIEGTWLYMDPSNYFIPSHEMMHIVGADHTADYNPRLYSYARCSERISWQIRDANIDLVQEFDSNGLRTALHCERNNIMSYAKEVGTECGNPTFYTPDVSTYMQKIMSCWTQQNAL